MGCRGTEGSSRTTGCLQYGTAGDMRNEPGPALQLGMARMRWSTWQQAGNSQVPMLEGNARRKAAQLEGRSAAEQDESKATAPGMASRQEGLGSRGVDHNTLAGGVEVWA